MKTQGVILSLHNSSIMDKSMSHNGKNGSMISQRNQALISAKKKDHYFIYLYRKAKILTIITSPKGDLIMYLR